MGETYRSIPERVVDLRGVAVRPLSVLFQELRIIFDGDQRVVVEADLTVDGAIYARSLDEGHFGLDLPGRNDGPEPELDKPVKLVVRLRPHLADAAMRAKDPMEDILKNVFEGSADFANTDVWRATDVTQEVAPGVAMGYRTAWAT